MNDINGHNQKLFYNLFPSPKGVNYYKLVQEIAEEKEAEYSFRPLQGLTIINSYKHQRANNTTG